MDKDHFTLQIILDENTLKQMASFLAQEMAKQPRFRPEINNTGNSDEVWVGRQKAMEILGCKKSKLQQLRNHRRIRFSRSKSGRIIRYLKSSLLKYLEENEVKPISFKSSR